MPTYSHELELLGWLASTLNDTELKASGINPANGTGRTVGVYSQPNQNAPFPYIRYRITDTNPIEEQTFNASFVPNAKRVMVTVDVFTNYEPELLKIQSRVYDLLKHATVTTAHFKGRTYYTTGQNLPIEDIGTPDKITRHWWLRFKADLEPNA